MLAGAEAAVAHLHSLSNALLKLDCERNRVRIVRHSRAEPFEPPRRTARCGFARQPRGVCTCHGAVQVVLYDLAHARLRQLGARWRATVDLFLSEIAGCADVVHVPR